MNGSTRTANEYPVGGNLNWAQSTWLPILLVAWLIVVIWSALTSGASPEFAAGQVVLLASLYISLHVLADRPLINPVQAVVLFFYWWFGCGPVMTSTFHLVAGNADLALSTQEAGKEALWIVAAGLPVFSMTARATLRYMERAEVHARFLVPVGFHFRPATLLAYWSVGALALAIIEALEAAGVQGVEYANYLGGTKTTIWWIGVLNAVGQIGVFALVGVLATLSVPKANTPVWLKLAGAALVIQTVGQGLTSGWKGAIMVVFIYILSFRITAIQRPPWLTALVLVVVYLFVVEPFVSTVRIQAEMAGAQTVSEREALFADAIRKGELAKQITVGGTTSQPNTGETTNQANTGETTNQANTGETTNQANTGETTNQANTGETTNQANTGETTNQANTGGNAVRVESLFRGIYPLAGEVTRRTSPLEGEWKGMTIGWALQVVVPRALLPDKPDSDVGNFFSRTIGADIGVSRSDDYNQNVAVSIPFEIIGNYGWLPGLASFAAIGFLWALICGWLLSPARLSNHPLAPYFVVFAMNLEHPLAGYLGALRNMLFPLAVAAVIWLAFRRRI